MEIIDTLAYAKRLIQSGVPESQAEIQAETLSKALSEVLSNNVATKLDIKELETKNKGVRFIYSHTPACFYWFFSFPRYGSVRYFVLV